MLNELTTEQRYWLLWIVVLGLFGLLCFLVSIRDWFRAREQMPGEELSDYLHNDWLRAKNLLCYGRDR